MGRVELLKPPEKLNLVSGKRNQQSVQLGKEDAGLM